jgi:MFS family permease
VARNDRADASFHPEERHHMKAPNVPPMRGPYSGELTDPNMSAVRRGFGTVLRNRLFLRLWVAQLISQTIQNASNYAVIILIATISNSVTFTSLAIVAFSLPPALFGAAAGVLVDRFNRRTVLWVSNVLRAAAAAGFVLSLIVDKHALIPVLLLSFVTALIGQFFAPAEGAAIPQLVHKDELMNALALFNITFTLAQAFGLIILGPVIINFIPTVRIGTTRHGFNLTSVEVLFILVAALYIVCALLILSIPRQKFLLRRRGGTTVPLEPAPSQSPWIDGIWHGIVESWNFMRRDHALFASVLQLCLGGTIVAVVATIAPEFVYQFFHKDPSFAALVLFPAGVGLVIGSAITPAVVKRLHYMRTVGLGIILLSVCAVLLTLVRAVAEAIDPHHWWSDWPYLGTAVFLILLIGFALDFINVPAQTRMQEHSPDWIKGRVLALQGMLLNAVTVPSVVLIGLAADNLGLSNAMALLAVVIVVAGLASLSFGSPSGASPDGKQPAPPATIKRDR